MSAGLGGVASFIGSRLNDIINLQYHLAHLQRAHALIHTLRWSDQTPPMGDRVKRRRNTASQCYRLFR